MKSSSLASSFGSRRWQAKGGPQIQPRGREHHSSVVMELFRGVGDVGSPSGSKRDSFPRSMPQFPHSVPKISERGSS